MVALTNGNYVVDFAGFSSDTGSTGAVTWGNGSTGTTGTVSAANSLVGSSSADIVGRQSNSSPGGVTALSNGNYVVASPYWGNDAGAVTWADGTTGVVGTISSANSLIGSHPSNGPATFSDQIGTSVTALSNGNYVVDSPHWFGNTGAVTWGNGTTGTTGVISAANSLVGSYSSDDVGNGGVTALSNGNYVVVNSSWNNFAGAVTWGDGTTGVAGPVSSANSLVGSTSSVGSLPGDQLGGIADGAGGVSPLPDGNYVVFSPFWNQFAGAVTWGNGTTGTTGVVSAANSFIDIPALDYEVGAAQVMVFPNSNYVFLDNPGSVQGEKPPGLMVPTGPRSMVRTCQMPQIP